MCIWVNHTISGEIVNPEVLIHTHVINDSTKLTSLHSRYIYGCSVSNIRLKWVYSRCYLLKTKGTNRGLIWQHKR